MVYRINYDELKPGNLVIFENLPFNEELKPSLVSGVVERMSEGKITLASSLSPKNGLSDSVNYSRRRIRNIRRVQEDLEFDAINNSDSLTLGDLLLVRSEEDKLAYFGFINKLGFDEIVLRNYFPGKRHPWFGRTEYVIERESAKNHLYAVLLETKFLDIYF